MDRMNRGALVAVLVGVACSHALSAQELRGIVRDSASRQPILGAVVMLLDSAGGALARSISNQRGEYRLPLVAAAQRVRTVRLGFRPRTLPLPSASGAAVQLDVTLAPIPYNLEAVQVVAAPSCPRRSDGPAALSLLQQARAGLLATVVARSVTPARMKRLVFHRTMDGNSDRIAHQRVHIDFATGPGSFGAGHSAVDFVRQGFREDSAGYQVYFGPDAEVLLDDGFANGYCFHIMDTDRDRPHQIGLGFQAADRRRDRIDIEGALWIDTLARALTDIEFLYVGVNAQMQRFNPGGRISFREMPNGVVLLDRWFLRLVDSRQDSSAVMSHRGEPVRQAVGRPSAQQVGGEIAHASWPDGTAWQASLGTVHITAMTRSLLPAAEARVRLDDTHYEAVADSNGDVTITDLLPGPYQPVIIDPRLSAFDISIPAGVPFTATRDSTVTIRLEVPTAEDYVRALCQATDKRIGSAWLLGRIVTPDGLPVAGASWAIQRRLDAVGWVTIVEGGEVSASGVFSYCRLDKGSALRIVAKRDNWAGDHYETPADRLSIFTIELRPPRL